MTNLQYISMGSNFLSGNIPSEIGQLQNLLVASFNFNDFAGSIPTIFGNLPKLEYLSLGGNSYTGPIPKEFGSLKNLKSLDMGQITYLNGNRYEGVWDRDKIVGRGKYKLLVGTGKGGKEDTVGLRVFGY